MTNKETITITVAEYERLLKESDFLGCLQAAGVDNWHGYDEAREMMREGQDD